MADVTWDEISQVTFAYLKRLDEQYPEATLEQLADVLAGPADVSDQENHVA